MVVAYSPKLQLLLIRDIVLMNMTILGKSTKIHIGGTELMLMRLQELEAFKSKTHKVPSSPDCRNLEDIKIDHHLTLKEHVLGVHVSWFFQIIAFLLVDF